MPPRRGTATLIQDLDSAVDIEFDTEMNTPKKTHAEQSLDMLMEQLQDDQEAFLSIAKISNLGEAFATRIPADKFDFVALQEHLQDEFGGGDFRVRVYKNKKLIGNKLIQIIKKNTSKENNSENLGGSIIREMIDRMEKSNQQMLELIQQKNIQPAPKTTQELLQELLLMKQVLGGDVTRENPIVQLRGTIELLQSLGVSVGGIKPDDEKEEGFSTMLEKMLPLATAIMTNKNTGQNIPQPNPQPRKQDRQMIQQQMIKAAINDLLRAAKKGREVSVYAEEVVDRVPENILRNLVSTNFVEEMAKVNAEVTAHAPWFVELGEHVKAQLGMPSTVEYLYSDDESDINDETDHAIDLDAE